MIRALVLVAAVFMLGGCAGDESASETTTDTETVTLPAFSDGRVYWLRDGKVWPTYREIEASSDPVAAIMRDLVSGPTSQERGDLEATTAIPEGAEPEVVVEDGVAAVELDDELSVEARAQIAYTLTQFPEVESVVLDGMSYTRADFEEQTPSVLVESPLPFAQVSSPLRVTGTANTFEATFQYELLDGEGNVVDKNFVTATSGTGTRGTFEFTTGDFGDVATLVVFENSAEDGSRIHEVEIPLSTAP